MRATRADRRAHVATTDLAAAFDEHHAELGDVGGEAIEDELAIPRLEHVERKQLAGQHDVAEWEHRQLHRPILAFPGHAAVIVAPAAHGLVP